MLISLQKQFDWDAAAVTVDVFWVSRVFNIQRQKWHGSARASADAALCGAASTVMSLLQQIPEDRDHDQDDVHIKLAQ